MSDRPETRTNRFVHGYLPEIVETIMVLLIAPVTVAAMAWTASNVHVAIGVLWIIPGLAALGYMEMRNHD